MGKTKKGKTFSRRKFVTGMGAGLVGSYAWMASQEAASQQEESPHAEAEQFQKGKEKLSLRVNGKAIQVWVEPRTTLAELLRDQLHLTGTKVACNQGECGSCTVVMDGKAVYSCHLLALDAAHRDVITIEGLLNNEELHPVQKAFLDHDGFQCGFCTSGQIMAAHALLLKIPDPNRRQILEGMSGNICRCSAYPHIIESVLAAADRLKH